MGGVRDNECAQSCLLKNASVSAQDSGFLNRLKFSVLCPPHGLVERGLTNLLLLILSWAVPWSILGDACMPGSNIFGLIIVFDACVLAGLLVSAIKIPSLPPLPPLLGMLIAGFCLRNIPVINVAKDIDRDWSIALRSIALTLILVKAGLELDASALKKVKGVCIRLTALPCIVETITCALACRFLLGFPWEWGFILGFVLGAVSPAVIVPSLLTLQNQGYGVDQGIPTLVIAASSFDDVLAISGFSVVLSIAFSQVSSGAQSNLMSVNGTSNITDVSMTTYTPEPATGDLVWTILRGPVEMVGGVLIGVIIGMILWSLPASNIKKTTRDRSLLVVSCGILVLFGSRNAGFRGAGALAAIVLAFVAAISWKESKEKVSGYVGILWNLFEPIMFGLIGAEISLEELDSATLGLSVVVLFIGLMARSLACFFAVSCSGFTNKEKLLICFAWLPKATVQAAIGSTALDTARNMSAPAEIENLAKQVLTIAVLSIIITAPFGAAAIGLMGPKLLQKSVSTSTERDTADVEGGDKDLVQVIDETSMQESTPLKEIDNTS